MLDTMKMSGVRPSSFMAEGRNLRFHCWSTMRVLSNPASAMAAPTARAPAGASFMDEIKNGSIRVRWSNAHAITVVRSCSGATLRRRFLSATISPGLISSSPR